jgi:two-component system cell cycle sensor histidine kinase/response regulator CckA
VTLTERDRIQRFKMPKGDYLMLAVSDTGTGMAASTCERIFDPFFTTKNEGEGTGLGLSTVFEIVKAMGGGIRVSSQRGQGTTFYIYLPRTSRSPNCEPVPTAAVAIGGAETILVVEDEEGVRVLVTSMLERAGYQVVTAADAEEARTIANERHIPVDLVVSDVMMPDGTGPELVHSLGTAERRPRALYMSGYAGAVLARQGRMANDSEFLQKPFTGAQLLAKVRQLLDTPAA